MQEERVWSPEQTAIIRSKNLEADQLILACAGSGKTAVLVQQVGFLIRELSCDPSSCLLVTFTRKARRKLQRDLRKLLGQEALDKILVGTFHSLGAKCLYACRKQTTTPTDSREPAPEQWLQIDELLWRWKDWLSIDGPEAQKYRQRIRYVFVDEFQDCNHVQDLLVAELRRTTCRVTVVGDDDQNVYGFRGSDIKYITQFPNYPLRKCQEFYLSTNYRSTAPIVLLGNCISSLNHKRLKKPASVAWVRPEDPDPPKPVLVNTYNAFQGAQRVCREIAQLIRTKHVDASDICILARNSFLLHYAEALLLQDNIACTVYSSSSHGGSAQADSDGEAEEEDGEEENHNRKEEETYETKCVGGCTDAKRRTLRLRTKRVVLSTIHSAKGLEWPHVYVIGLHRRFFPDCREPDIERERRLFYVAVTRAKRHLTVVNCFSEPSGFLCELQLQRPLAELFTFADPKWNGLFERRRHKSALGGTPIQPWTTCGVTRAIRCLTGEHYRYMKQHFLPIVEWSSSKCSSLLTNTNKPTGVMEHSDFVLEHGLQGDFGTFFDCLARRMIAQQQQQSESASSEVNNNNFLWTDRQAEKLLIEKPNQQQPNVFLFSDSQRKRLVSAYAAFRDVTRGWQTVLQDIYLVSCCKNILLGRVGCLYKGVTEQHLQEYMPLYNNMWETIQLLLAKTNTCPPTTPTIPTPIPTPSPLVSASAAVGLAFPVSYCQRATGKELSLSGEVDCRIGATILDFKSCRSSYASSSCPSSSQQVEHLLQVLLYASMVRLSGQDVRQVALYHLLLNQVFLLDISGWNKHQDLCDYVLSVACTDTQTVL